MALEIKTNGQNVVLRNLQEQVQKNKEDIAKHYEIDRALSNLGIKIVGQVESGSNLPDPLTYPGEYGDTYAVGVKADVEAGISTYVYYVFTRPDLNAGIDTNQWLDVGPISIVGPEGPQGPKGEKGDTGTSSKWITGLGLPTTGNNGDMFLNSRTGDIYHYVNNKWIYVNNSKGPQGPIGEQGRVGPIGPAGVQGPKGPQGDPAGLVNIVGVLSTTDLLPLPSTLNNLKSAYLIGSEPPYRLYIQIGNSSADAIWTDVGLFNTPYLDAIDIGAGISSDATEGSISQYNIDLILNNKDRVKILLFGEYYSLADDRQESEDVLIFSHVGMTNDVNYVKTLLIALDENRWFLDGTAVGVGETIYLEVESLDPGYTEVELDAEQTKIIRKYKGRVNFKINNMDTYTVYMPMTGSDISDADDYTEKQYNYELVSHMINARIILSIYDSDPSADTILGDLDIQSLHTYITTTAVNLIFNKESTNRSGKFCFTITAYNTSLMENIQNGYYPDAQRFISNECINNAMFPATGEYTSSGTRYLVYGLKYRSSNGILDIYMIDGSGTFATAQIGRADLQTYLSFGDIAQRYN